MASDGIWSARRLFHLCIYDHMIRRNRPRAALLFAREVGLGNFPNVSGVPHGLLADFTAILLDTWQGLPSTPNQVPSTQVNNDQNGSGVPMLGQDMHQQVGTQYCSTGTSTGGMMTGEAVDGGLGPNVGEAGGSQQAFEDFSFDIGFLGFENSTPFQPSSSHDSYSRHHVADMVPQENPRDNSCNLGNRSRGDLPISGDVNKGKASDERQDAGPNVGEASGSQDFSFDIGLLGFDNSTAFQPSSSHYSYSQQHVADMVPQENPRDTSSDLGNRSRKDLALSGDANISIASDEHQDAGTDGQVNLTPPGGWPSTGTGEYTAGVNFSDIESFSPVPTQEPHFWPSTLPDQQEHLSQDLTKPQGEQTSNYKHSNNFGSQRLSIPGTNEHEPHFWQSTLPYQKEHISEDSTKPQGEQTSNFKHSNNFGSQTLPIPGTNEQCVRDSERHAPIEENRRSDVLSNDDNSGLMRVSTSLQRGTTTCRISEPNGLTFEEARSFRPTNDKLLCCHFSGCGTMLASAGHEKKVFIWSLQNSTLLYSLDGHSDTITDVRFQRMSRVVATSSVDRTIQIWDCRKPRNSVVRLLGHNQQVNSVDFHPLMAGVLASCDISGEIRIWNVDARLTKYTLMGGTRQVRFQPRSGRYLAAASGNKLNLFDLDDGGRHLCLEGHVEEIRSICWESDGKHLASVSADRARIWSVGDDIKSICELHSSGGNKFESCVFHPGYSLMLGIGSFKTISLWNPADRDNPYYTASVTAHDGVVASLADCTRTERLASASHDGVVKLWK